MFSKSFFVCGWRYFAVNKPLSVFEVLSLGLIYFLLGFRENLKLWNLSLFRSSSFLYFYCKEWELYFLDLDWSRKLLFYYVLELGPEHTSHILLELVTALGFWTVDLGILTAKIGGLGWLGNGSKRVTFGTS